mgnify:CR=1 FL=1
MENEEIEAASAFHSPFFIPHSTFFISVSSPLAQNSTKQIELFPTAMDVGCEKKLVYAGQAMGFAHYGSPMTDRGFGVQSNRKVDVYLRIRNARANGVEVLQMIDGSE